MLFATLTAYFVGKIDIPKTSPSLQSDATFYKRNINGNFDAEDESWLNHSCC